MARPLKFKDPKELEKKINDYFKECDSRTKVKHIVTKDGVIEVDEPFPKPYTIEGLAVFLDTNRETLINYSNREPFFDIIMRAKEKIQANKIEGGLDRTYDPGVLKFMMINNYGYKDKLDQQQDDKNININIQYPDSK